MDFQPSFGFHPKWIRRETFQELKVPLMMANMGDLADVDRKWKNVLLPSANHLSLYTVFFGYGAQVIHRPNRDGEIELFYCAEDEEELQIFDRIFRFGVQLAKDERTHFQINLLVWDREDLPPYEIPFIFNLEDQWDRYSACAFVEQEMIPFFLLRKMGVQLMMIRCDAFVWTEKMREAMRDWLRKAYREEDSMPEVLVDQIAEELTDSGWAYEFDAQTLLDKLGTKEQAISYLRERAVSALEILAKHRNSGLRKGPFLAWIVEKDGVYGATGPNQTILALIITPYYWNRARGRKTDRDHCIELFEKSIGFIRAEAANPLYERAIPLYRMANEKIQRVAVTERFWKALGYKE